MRNTTKTRSVKRWDAVSHTTSDWDGLRRDEELWQQDGNCLVHLYDQGKSRRGSSFKISHLDLLASGLESFLHQYLSRQNVYPKSASLCLENCEFELYIPVPEETPREGTLIWHLTTRNFFAWILNKPLVGVKLGRTLIDLHERIKLFCPHMLDRTERLLVYIHEQGYADFVNNPEYALACLNFAENVKIKDLWIDAFSHCVGMNEKLDLSPEFNDVSMVTKALITRAYLEMDLHLGRVSRALRNFLEDELSAAHLGLPAPARAHLERFRSFLHSYHVNKFGYWPPGEGALLEKSVLSDMTCEFQALYDYLVDNDASIHPKAASGGICVLQNIDAFNARHNYKPLPHSSSLLPDYQVMDYKTSSQKSLRSFKLGSKNQKSEDPRTARSALAVATNTTPECALVQNFMWFERELSCKSDERLTVADGRKVRWIVVYTILQMLVNATWAPKEVREADIAPYHLCVLTAGAPPFAIDEVEPRAIGTPTPESDYSLMQMMPRDEKNHSAAPSIHPDCEEDDYFTHKTMPVAALKPPPLRINTNVGVTRSSSMKVLQRSLTNFTLPSRGTSLKSSKRKTTKPNPFEMSVAEYSPTDSRRHSGYSFAIQEEKDLDYLHPRTPDAVQHDNYSHPEARARTPTFDVHIFDPSPCDSPSTPGSHTSSAESSALSRMWGNSSIDDSECFWDDRRNSRGIYSMDHDSVCGISISEQSRKCSNASSPAGRASPLTHTFASLSAAAVPTKMVSGHPTLCELQQSPIYHPQPLQKVPDWYAEGQWTDELFGFSVPQEVPEESVTAFRTSSEDSVEEQDTEVESSTVDIFEALSLMDTAIR